MVYSLNRKTEAVSSSEMSVNFHGATERYIPEDSIRQTSQIHQTWRHISTDSIFDSHTCEIKYNVFAASARYPLGGPHSCIMVRFCGTARTAVLIRSAALE
jgi:hypothetical protein